MSGLAVVTGAGSGIGRALAREGRARGCRVIGVEADPSRAADLESELAGNGQCLVGDVRRVDDLRAVAAACRNAAMDVRFVFANAGVLRTGRPWEQSEADRDFVIDVNIKGALNCVSVFAPLLFAQASPSALVFTASLASFAASPGFDAYAASKHAVHAIAAAFAQETRARAPHVRSVLLCPGAVRTAIADAEVDGPAARLQALTRQRASDGAAPETVARAAFEAIAAGEELVLLDERALPAIASRAQALGEGRLV